EKLSFRRVRGVKFQLIDASIISLRDPALKGKTTRKNALQWINASVAYNTLHQDVRCQRQ
ncbi:hypothetical protein Bpfe_022937, partial [Biomphalaria pfeifferi]